MTNGTSRDAAGRTPTGRDDGAQLAVVGGGLAGLVAAVRAARAGRRVVLFERAHELGGRAQTTTHGGFRFNLGPHALFAGGAARRVLRELGFDPTGGKPGTSGSLAVHGGAAHTMPVGLFSLLTTDLFAAGEKRDAVRVLLALDRTAPPTLAGTSVDDWLAGVARTSVAADLARALLRVSTYAADSARLDAGAALANFQLARKHDVLYLDGGWATIVDSLREAAVAAGVRLGAGAKVVAVEHDDRVRGVRLEGGRVVPVAAAIVATSPAGARGVLQAGGAPGARGAAVVAAWANGLIPVEAACLDVGLSALPRPRARFALGVDVPTYFSVHSAVARLATEGAATIHVAKYLPTHDATPAADVEHELEAMLDMIQPGWREVIVERRFLPRMTVTHALPQATTKGLAGRPGPAVPGVHGLWLAGDWIGGEGMLADASVASAASAVDEWLAGLAAQTTPAAAVAGPAVARLANA